MQCSCPVVDLQPTHRLSAYTATTRRVPTICFSDIRTACVKKIYSTSYKERKATIMHSLCFVTALASLLVSAASKPFASASCLYHGSACSKTEAVRSQFCRPGMSAEQQTKRCITEACTYCLRKAAYQETFPCDSAAISGLCDFSFAEKRPVSALDAQIGSPTPSTSLATNPTQTVSVSPTPTPTVTTSSTATPAPSQSPTQTTISTTTVTTTPSILPSLAQSMDATVASQAPATQFPSPCVWSVPRDQVSVDLSSVQPATWWTPCKRNGLYGLVYKKERTHGIDGKGEHGVMCFDVRAPSDGTYYLTALSYAPHNTEHNDVWVRCSKPIELWRHANSRSKVEASTWLKAYQNKGKAGISEEWKTIDRNGHRLLIPGLLEDEIFQVCLSGRSYQYELFRLVFIRCQGPYCTGKMYEHIAKRPISVCVPHKI